jgi:hypothetical protein
VTDVTPLFKLFYISAYIETLDSGVTGVTDRGAGFVSERESE